jgi:branched-chain amino acid transport system permease protein
MSELSTPVEAELADEEGVERAAGVPAPPPRRRRLWLELAVLLLIVVVLFAAPFVVNNYLLFILNLTLVYAIATLGFDILIGWSGQIGLAHAALFAVGAYGSTIAVTRYEVPYLLTLPMVAIVAALFAVLIGFPAIRLTGFFLAIATLAFGFVIIEALTAADEFTGGGAGMSVDVWRIPGITGSASTYFLTAAVAVLAFLMARRSLHGRFGRTLQTVRHLGPLVGSLGISALRYRLVAFGVSGGIAAVAGALYAQLQTFIFPAMFDFNLLVPFLVMVFVGGAGSLLGPVIGAAFAVVLVELFQDLGDLQAIAYGVALMLAITVLPGGLVSLGARLRDSRLVARVTGRRAERTAVRRAQ